MFCRWAEAKSLLVRGLESTGEAGGFELDLFGVGARGSSEGFLSLLLSGSMTARADVVAHNGARHHLFVLCGASMTPGDRFCGCHERLHGPFKALKATRVGCDRKVVRRGPRGQGRFGLYFQVGKGMRF